MGKILTVKKAIEISKKLKKENKTIVLVGGCFDILHIGHIQFLKKAKEKADILFVLLESDSAIKKIKGITRPIHIQKERAEILSRIELVDYIVMLPFVPSEAYDDLVISIHPDVIATTHPDLNRHHKERQAKKLEIKVVDVTERIKNASSSRIAETIAKEI